MGFKRKAKVGAGTAIGAVLAAGAAAYFFSQTKSGKQTTKKIKEHAAHLSTEISHRVSRARTISKKKYEEIVDEIVDEYGKHKSVADKTVAELKKDLKSHWLDVQRELKAGKRATTKPRTAGSASSGKPKAKKKTTKLTPATKKRKTTKR